MCLAIKENLIMKVSKQAQYESSQENVVREALITAREIIKKKNEIKILMIKQNEIKALYIQNFCALIIKDYSQSAIVAIYIEVASSLAKRREKLQTFQKNLVFSNLNENYKDL